MSLLKTAAEEAAKAGAIKGIGHAISMSSSQALKRLPVAIVVETALVLGKESIAVAKKQKPLAEAVDTMAEKGAEMGGTALGAAVGVAAVSAIGGGIIVSTAVSAGAALALGMAGQKAYRMVKAKVLPGQITVDSGRDAEKSLE